MVLSPSSLKEYPMTEEKVECTEENICELEGCTKCCDHEFDSSEGGYCLNCEKHATD